MVKTHYCLLSLLSTFPTITPAAKAMINAKKPIIVLDFKIDITNIGKKKIRFKT